MKSLDTKSFLKLTHKELQAFMKKLGPEEFRTKQNYFRWLEYPLALTLAEVKAGQRILEIGSGYVNVMPLYAASKLGATVTAVDKEPMPPEAVSHIKSLTERCGIPEGRLTVREADATKLPFADGSFDVVLCVSTLEHVRLSEDSAVAREIGRVLAPGGRAIISVPFNHGEHVESEDWGGEDYSQRHYNEYTARWRIVFPSGLWFQSATVFGETDTDAGKRYLEMPEEDRVRFCAANAGGWEKYWKIYYRIERDDFYINAHEVPDEIARDAGLIAIVLEKKETEPERRFFDYKPFEFYLGNDRATKTLANSGQSLAIDRVRIMNGKGDEMDVFESGQNCLVEIRFTIKGEVEDPLFYVAFHDADGRVVCCLNTRRAGCELAGLRGMHTLMIRFGMLNLLGGKYDLTVGAWEYETPDPVPPYPYDVHYRKYSIVMKDRLPGLTGVAHSPYDMRLD